MFIGDVFEFMFWFLNVLYLVMNGIKKLNSIIVNKIFRGKMRVYIRKVLLIDLVSFYWFLCKKKIIIIDMICKDYVNLCLIFKL